MQVSYPELFPSSNFRVRKFSLGGKSCNSLFFARFILLFIYMCLYVLICD